MKKLYNYKKPNKWGGYLQFLKFAGGFCEQLLVRF